MSKYTQPLNKQEALQVKAKNENALAYYPECSDTNDIVVNIVAIKDWDLQFIYNQRQDCLYITREDYAMYVKGNKPLPEGYGYASKSFEDSKYDGLEYCTFGEHTHWVKWNFPNILFTTEKTGILKDPSIWYLYAFKLEDLARVEAETNEITQEQAEWLEKNYPNIKIDYIRKLYQKGVVYRVTQETKDLIDREMPLATLNQAGEPALNPNNEHFEEIAERLQYFDKEDETSKEQPYEDLEAQIENLQSALILQKSKAKVLISHYKDRSKLDQAISKLEEELTNG
jgi:hypothetical protein